MQTWGVDGPGDEREDTMISPTQESDDVLREVVWEKFIFAPVELFEFLLELSAEVEGLREDPYTQKYPVFTKFII